THVTVAVEHTTVIVDDDGPGIPPEDRERVFERFARGRRTQAPGSGLGLAIVAQQAQLHHGHAEARNSPKGGARLILSTSDDPRGQGGGEGGGRGGSRGSGGGRGGGESAPRLQQRPPPSTPTPVSGVGPGRRARPPPPARRPPRGRAAGLQRR